MAEIAHITKVVNSLSTQAASILQKDFQHLTIHDEENLKQIKKELSIVLKGQNQGASLNFKAAQILGLQEKYQIEVKNFEDKLHSKIRTEISQRSQYLIANVQKFEKQSEKVKLSSEKLLTEIIKIQKLASKLEEAKLKEASLLKAKVETILKQSQSSLNDFTIHARILSLSVTRLDQLANQKSHSFIKLDRVIKELSLIEDSITFDSLNLQTVENQLRCLQEDFNKLLKILSSQVPQKNNSNSMQQELMNSKEIFDYQSNSSAQPIQLKKLSNKEVSSHSKKSSLTEEDMMNLQNVNELSILSLPSDNEQDSFKNMYQVTNSLEDIPNFQDSYQEDTFLTKFNNNFADKKYSHQLKQRLSSLIEECRLEMNKLNDLLKKQSERLSIVQKDQSLLLKDDKFHDYEKKKEVTSFSSELDKKFIQLSIILEERDNLIEKFKLLEDMHLQSKDQGEFKIQMKVHQDLILELKNQISQLYLKAEDQLNDEVHYCHQVNQKIIQKYEFKRNAINEALATYDNLRNDLLKALQQIEKQESKILIIQGNYASLTNWNQSSQLSIKEDQTVVMSIQAQISQIQSLKAKICEIFQELQGFVQVAASNQKDVQLYESKVVKTLKIEEFLKLIQNVKQRFDKHQALIIENDSALKDMEIFADTFLMKIRGARILEMNFRIEQLSSSIFGELEPLLEGLNSQLNEFRSYLQSKSGQISSSDLSYLDIDGKIQKTSIFEANRDSYVTNLQLLNSKQSLIDQQKITLEESRGILQDTHNVQARVQSDIDLIRDFKNKLIRIFKEYIENNDEEMRRKKIINDFKTIQQDNQRSQSLLLQKLEYFQEEFTQFQAVLRAINGSHDFKAKRQHFDKRSRRLQEFQVEVQKINDKLKSEAQCSINVQSLGNSLEELNLKELRKLLTQAEDSNYTKEVLERDIDEILLSLSKKRSKLGDADISRIQSKRANEIDSTKEEFKAQENLMDEFEIMLQERSFERNQDKFSPEKKGQMQKALSELKQQQQDIKDEIERIELQLKTLRHTQLKYLKLNEYQTNLQLKSRYDYLQLADFIMQLSKMEQDIKGCFVRQNQLSLDLQVKMNQISSLDVEKRLKRLSQQIQETLNQEQQIRTDMGNYMKIVQNYLEGGYTSSDPDEEFFQVITQESKELISDFNLQTRQFEQIINDTNTLLQTIAKRRTGSGNLSELDMESWNDQIGKLEVKAGKLRQQRKDLENQVFANRERLAYHDVDLKLGRRKQEAEELERIIGDIVEDVTSIKERLQSDQETCLNTGESRYSSYLEKLSQLITKTETVQENANDINEKRLEIESAIDFAIQELQNASYDVQSRIQGLEQNLVFKKQIQQTLKQIQQLHQQVKHLFTSTNQALATKPSDQIFKPPPGADEVDKMLSEILNRLGFYIPIKKLGGGYYNFGTKKIFCKIINGKLVVRVGGGYMGIEEFIVQHGQLELERLNSQAVVEQRMKEKDEQRQIKARVKTAASGQIRDRQGVQSQQNLAVKRTGSARGVRDEIQMEQEEEKGSYLNLGSDDETSEVNSSRAFGSQKPISSSLSMKQAYQKSGIARGKAGSKAREDMQSVNQSKNYLTVTPQRRLNSPSSTTKSDQDDVHSQGGGSIGGGSTSNQSMAVRSAQAKYGQIAQSNPTKFQAPDQSFLRKGLANLPKKLP